MPQRRRTPRFMSPEVQGDDSWVEMLFPTQADARENAREITELEAKVKEMHESGEHDKDELTKFEEYATSRIYELMAPYVVNWNWVDDDGSPLVVPKVDPQVFDQLTSYEFQWLMQQFKSGIPAEKKLDGKSS